MDSVVVVAVVTETSEKKVKTPRNTNGSVVVLLGNN